MTKKITLISIGFLLLVSGLYFGVKQIVLYNWMNKQIVLDSSSEVPKYKLLVLIKKGFGEKEFAARIAKTCESMGWKCCICKNHLNGIERFFLKRPVHKLFTKFDPDITVNLQTEDIFSHKSVNFRAISGSFKKYLLSEKKKDDMLKFDAFLPSFASINELEQLVESKGRHFYGFPWYPTCSKTEACIVEPKRLFYCGINWDNTRNGEEYTKMFSLLDKTGYLDVYGPKHKWQHTPNSARGIIPFDGSSFFEALKKSGVTLVLHAEGHLSEGAPTARIFEAAAASTVIISDKHPFIVEQFGDSVLYVDQTKKGEELFKEIDAHMQWVLAHPEEAKKMAMRAHKIFVDKFTLESQLEHLANVHDQILRANS